MMTAALLTDRFHLTLVHQETELPVFALVRTKDRLLLKPIAPDPTSILSGGLLPPGSLFVHNGTVSDFIAYLQRYAPPEIDRPTVNQTNLPGRYEFELHFTPEDGQGGAHSPTEDAGLIAAPNVFTAIQDQLGLRLQPARAMVNVLHIISIDHPTPN
jgi:uncharacterized protein (TIGR03435 family)